MLLLLLHISGCSEHCTVLRTTPKCTAGSPEGKRAAREISRAARQPADALGRCADLAASAEKRLRAAPGDSGAREDYNFAVARIFEIIHEKKLRPWDAPVRARGRDGEWMFSFSRSASPGLDPRWQEITPADRYRFAGQYVKKRTLKAGLGAPLVVAGDESKAAAARFARGRLAYYGMTGLLRLDGRRCVLGAEDPLRTENVKFAGHTFPLAGDFTAPLALALAQENLTFFAMVRQLLPQKYADTTRIARLQPYDPSKIPVICVHGLIDSPATWVPTIIALRNDAEIRRRCQFLFFSYPSGYPVPFSAAIMRRQLDEFSALHPDHKKIVLIGHSMGGLISRILITDSGQKLWDACLPEPRNENALPAEARNAFADALIFRHRPEISRVIYVSTPHRGSTTASGWMGRIGTHLVRTPAHLTGGAAALESSTIPNSIETLSPDSVFVKTLSSIPTVPGVPCHSIMGDRGKGGNLDRTRPVKTDTYVPYWSSHLESARSELVVPSKHSAHQHEKAIAEIRRILLEHARR